MEESITRRRFIGDTGRIAAGAGALALLGWGWARRRAAARASGGAPAAGPREPGA